MNLTNEQKDLLLFDALRKSMKDYGVVNNLGRDKLFGQLLTEQLDCLQCPVESICRKNFDVHYCGEFIHEHFYNA